MAVGDLFDSSYVGAQVEVAETWVFGGEDVAINADGLTLFNRELQIPLIFGSDTPEDDLAEAKAAFTRDIGPDPRQDMGADLEAFVPGGMEVSLAWTKDGGATFTVWYGRTMGLSPDPLDDSRIYNATGNFFATDPRVYGGTLHSIDANGTITNAGSRPARWQWVIPAGGNATLTIGDDIVVHFPGQSSGSVTTIDSWTHKGIHVNSGVSTDKTNLVIDGTGRLALLGDIPPGDSAVTINLGTLYWRDAN